MEIFGIGTSELVFIILIAIIVLGPKDMQKAGKTVGRWLNRLMRSDGYKAFQRASREIRNLPTNLMREANLEDINQELRNTIDPRPPRPPVARTDPVQPPPNPAVSTPEPSTADTKPPATSSELPPQPDGNDPEQQ